MNRKPKCQPLFLVAGAAVVAGVIGGIFYYLNRPQNAEVTVESPVSATDSHLGEKVPTEEAPLEKAPAEAASAPVKKVEMSREELLEVTDEVIVVQRQLAALMTETSNQIVNKKLTGMKDVYTYLEGREVEDPVAKHGLTMEEFDNMISKFSDDPVVSEKVLVIMKGPGVSDAEVTSNATAMDIPTICSIVRSMLGAMQDLVKQLHVLEKMLGSRYKGHTASLAAQTALAAFLETEVHTTAETVEQAILLNQTELAENVEFLSSYANLQKLVADLDNSGEHPY